MHAYLSEKMDHIIIPSAEQLSVNQMVSSSANAAGSRKLIKYDKKILVV
jgi:hypothetical protein